MRVLNQGISTQPYEAPAGCAEGMLARYRALVNDPELCWPTCYRKIRLLGSGGQGVVYLGERRGSDRFTLPVALKIFSPQLYRSADDYTEDMKRIAHVAGRVALIQQDNLLNVHNFLEQDGVRIMEMEWLEGHDLSRLLTQRFLNRARRHAPPDKWEYLNDVIVTEGPLQPRLKPGVAIQVLRQCLAALAALHRQGIVHGDLKPSNILLKRTGSAKVIDIGSAIDLKRSAGRRIWSPVYAAPEVLAGAENSPQSDLASLGYVLVEMLSGRPAFAGLPSYEELRAAKADLETRLPELLPHEVSCNDLLLHLCRQLIAPDLERRFASAEAADLEREGAAEFHRQLVRGDLASEYENDIRVWLEQLG